MSSTKIKPAEAGQTQFSIVGIGASAGGLEALELFFENMPKDNGMAFVVIQHLDPNHPGIMPELLQRITPMRVCQVSEGLKVKPNCVYVIPPNKSLSILNCALHLFDPVESRGLRLPVDIFFRSLAADMHEKSIGIILSGMGSDGSLGIKAIKEQNGIVLVQDPVSAKFDGMPRSATEAVIADIVAPAQDLPSKLLAYLKFIPTIKPEPDIDSKSQSNLDKIIILLREQTGHDFSHYKKNTLFRRIERRKGIHQIDKITNYVRFLQENPKEVEILFKELLIGVTSFFRDAAVWERLKQDVLPSIFEELPNGYVLRASVPGCSTGEEAYSLAMVFKEAMDQIKNQKNLSLQIFATDLDPDAIEKARRGIFSSNITADVSPERLSRFFTVEPEGFRLNTAIREMVVFANQNVIKDPPFTRLDILTCRNMLIYMEAELQKKVISLFNYSLNPGGTMVLGTAETLGNFKEGFEDTDAKLRIFKRSGIFQASALVDFPSSFHHKKVVSPAVKTPAKPVENIQVLTDQLLLQRFSPASVLVNSTGDIIYMTGGIGKYLEPVAGKANWNIYAMARQGLREVLPVAIRKALQNFDPVILRNVIMGTNGGTHFADVTVQHIENPDSLKGMVIIIFRDLPAVVEHNAIASKTGKYRLSGRQKELEIELQRSYEDLQSTREEMQTSQEELKSTNEELQSTNEELQSSNEELSTSKEEMQSLNEELQTLNAELQSKINDYLRANDDMKNLLNSTEIATLFLDRDLNIRRFTDQVIKIIKLRSTDIGRPFTDLVTDLEYPEIDMHARQVLKTLVSVETDISTRHNRWFNVRIMPYRTLDDRIEGLVITFTDITIAKQAQQAMTISETRYRRLFESAKDGILILDAETGKIKDVNPFLIELLGYSKEQFLEKAILEIGLLKDIVANKDKFLELQEKEIVRYENLPLETAQGQKIKVEFISNVYLVAGVKVIQCFIRH
ncbi:MAG: PAS domain-containing protein [Bacteroidetes bacterium]|nr:PAS domain-containing protein [Bacteroidota bacterium]